MDEKERENLKKQQEFDQTTSLLGDFLPTMCWRLYNNYQDRGFTQQQAFTLVIAYVHGMSGGKLQ